MRWPLVRGRPCTPVSKGSEGPYTSASITPTAAPDSRSASARFTAVVLFPTPPLPEATAIAFRTPGRISGCAPAERSRPRVFEVIVTWTFSTPSSASTRSRAAFSNSALTGQAGVVSSIANETLPPSMRMFFTKPRSTMLLPKSGSTIGRRASRMTGLDRGAAMEILRIEPW